MILTIAPLSGVIPIASATTSGTCGANLKWTLDTETGVLNITGTGSMYSWTNFDDAPWCYDGCENYIKSVVIGDGVTSIGKNAFRCVYYNYAWSNYRSSYWNLSSITISDTVTSIGDYAFSNCDKITSITIPETVTSIGNGVFNDCDGLTSIKIPEYVTSINSSLFCDCDKLANVELGSNVTSIGSSAFYSCDGLANISIPDSVISIGNNAFELCTALTNISIPDSVKSIGSRAFKQCENLTGFNVDADNNYFSNDIYGVLFNEDKTTLIQYPNGRVETKYTIPDTVTSIGGYAFYACDTLTSVRIGNSVTSIETYAFAYSNGLTDIITGNSVESIKDYAFSNCSGLTGVTIGNSVKSVDYDAFINCSNLMRITMGKAVTNIGADAFNNCAAIKNVYYSGNSEDWEAITIGSNNTNLTGATRHYEYESSYTPIVLKEVTCTEDGIMSYSNESGDSFTELIPALGHSYELLRRVESTCTKKGTEVYKCKTCNKIYTMQLDLSEHTYDDGVCINCGKIYDISVPDTSSVIINREKNLISGLETGLDVESFMNCIVFSDDATVELDRDVVGTGTKVKVTDKSTSEVLEEYTIVIFGDYNGDGIADSEDTAYFASISNFEIFDYFEYDYLYMAADINGDGVVDNMDEEDMNAVANFEAYIDYTITSGSKVVRY